MSKADDEIQVLRGLAQDYRGVIENLKARGWIEQPREPQQGLITSTELAPPVSDGGYISINFDIFHVPAEGKNTVTIQLVARNDDDSRIKIFKAGDLVQAGREHALNEFSATVVNYARELTKENSA